MPDPADWRQRAREALPPGTRRRDAADRARAAALVARDAGGSLRTALAPGQGRAPLSQRRWLELHHRESESVDVRERLVGGLRAGAGPDVQVVIWDRLGTAGAREATWRSLQQQWCGQWSAHDAADPSVLVTTLASLATTCPSDPTLVVETGDTLRPDLVARIVDGFWENPSLQVVHWDEVGSGGDLRIRATYSPELALSANAWGRAFAARAEHWSTFEPQLGDAAWWSVLLGACVEPGATRRLARVAMESPRPHDPVPPGSDVVVQAELDRRGWPARAASDRQAVQLEWNLEEWPSVGIVIPSRFNQALLEPLLESLERTDYPSLRVQMVDNSGSSDDKASFYGRFSESLGLEVLWWDRPFNYSAVNNAGAALVEGEVLLFLNDDTEALSPDWLRRLIGWASRDEIGTAGAQLTDADGLIQHGGVVLGMDASAGHLFAGAKPGSDSLLGSTAWTRNVLAVTGACVATRRDVFDRCGGFDERFVLCGSDVVLGLEAHARGLRSVVCADVAVSHLEAATRGADSGVPEDLFASWWRYQRWLKGGDPYFSPSLSLESHQPCLRSPGEPSAATEMLAAMGRPDETFRQAVLEETSLELARAYPVGDRVVEAVRNGHAEASGRQDLKTLNWVLPPFDNPYYGGLATIIRIADQLAAHHGVSHRFVIADRDQSAFYRSALAAGSERLADCELVFLGGDGLNELDRIPAADGIVSTMWTTAYIAAVAPQQRRRFYLVQDFEPGFYPGGTLFALAEETYRLGLYGICNTEPIHEMYTQRYGGVAGWFLPAVDRDVFHPPAPLRMESRSPGDPVRIFVYARPGHWRNCWEIALPALQRLKETYGEGIHIVTAGSWASPDDLGGGIEHLGLLDVRSTGELYRSCDIGVALTVSEHPSYLPGELMACGVPVVAFDLPEAGWILQHEETGLRCRQTVEGLREQLARLIEDPDLRERCARGALAHIDAHHSDWDAALSGIWDLLCDPEATA